MFSGKLILCAFFLFLAGTYPAKAQKRVIHFVTTSGYDHQTRDVSKKLFETIAAHNGWEMYHATDAAIFSNSDSLLTYDAVIFSNTSGDALFDANQKANLEAFAKAGKGLMGIHAASDTYRHSLADGQSTGSWDFYPEWLGGSVQSDPHHVAGTPLYSIFKQLEHPAVQGIPVRWSKYEEYYYWLNGFLASDIQALLKVESTIGPNGKKNEYDSSRVVSWTRTTAWGGRVFYTSLGHREEDYRSDILFRQHLNAALCWVLGENCPPLQEEKKGLLELIPNPTDQHVKLQTGDSFDLKLAEIFSATGRAFRTEDVELSGERWLYVGGLSSGIYFLRFNIGDQIVTRKLIVIH